MSVSRSDNVSNTEPTTYMQPLVLFFVALVACLLIVIPLLPVWVTNVAYSFTGQAPKIYWYLSRAAGFVALTILWLAMALGLSITNKMARMWPGAPAAFSIHEYVSLMGLAFAIYHALVLMGDHFVDFSLSRLLTPFSIAYQTLWVGLGQVAFYAWVIVTLSFYVRKKIGPKVWRAIHYVNFATFVMGMSHGIFSGSDSGTPWVKVYYWTSALSLLTLLVFRIYETHMKRGFADFKPVVVLRVQKLIQTVELKRVLTMLTVTIKTPLNIFSQQSLRLSTETESSYTSLLAESVIDHIPAALPERTAAPRTGLAKTTKSIETNVPVAVSSPVVARQDRQAVSSASPEKLVEEQSAIAPAELSTAIARSAPVPASARVEAPQSVDLASPQKGKAAAPAAIDAPAQKNIETPDLHPEPLVAAPKMEDVPLVPSAGPSSLKPDSSPVAHSSQQPQLQPGHMLVNHDFSPHSRELDIYLGRGQSFDPMELEFLANQKLASSQTRPEKNEKSPLAGPDTVPFLRLQNYKGPKNIPI